MITGFPLKIFTGRLMISMSLPVFGYVLKKVCLNLDNELEYLMSLFKVNGVA